MRSRGIAFGAVLCGALLGTAPARAQDAGAAQVCQRWVCDRANLDEGTSTADVASCDAGAWNGPGQANSLRLVNLYRFIASMPAVTEDPSYDTYAQDCALLQAAATDLSHTPDASTPCYSAAAATGSAHSSICSGQGVECIDLYMQDGDSPEMGHRRWMFANYLGPVGFGSVGSGGQSMTGSCFYQPAGTSNAHKAYVAWPPAGTVPLQAITTTQADTAGWTIQSDSIDLSAATVTVADGNTNETVTVSVLPQNYGSMYAIRVLPKGWTSAAGHSYQVSVAGVPSPFSYGVDVVDCASFAATACSSDDGGAAPAGDGGSSSSGSSSSGSSSGSAHDAGGDATGGGPGAANEGGTSGDAGDDSGSGASSSGSAPSSAAHGSGCSCSVPRSGAGSIPACAWLLGAVVVIARRRRR